MIAINNNQVVEVSETIIDKDCEITLLPPIAGGYYNVSDIDKLILGKLTFLDLAEAITRP